MAIRVSDPCEHGFCHALGTGTVTHGVDLFLTDLGDRYFVAIDSDRGFIALKQVQAQEIMVQPDDEGVLAPRDVVRAGEVIAGEDLVQAQQRVDVTGVKGSRKTRHCRIHPADQSNYQYAREAQPTRSPCEPPWAAVL